MGKELFLLLAMKLTLSYIKIQAMKTQARNEGICLLFL
jgi:hypothetical protein